MHHTCPAPAHRPTPAHCPARRKLDPNACPACGYDLTGNELGVCPECGAKAMLNAEGPGAPGMN